MFIDTGAGISLSSWQRFLKIFTETSIAEKMDQELEKLATSIAKKSKKNNEKHVALVAKIQEIIRLTEEI